MALASLRSLTIQILSVFWISVLVLVGLGIYKYLLFDVLAGWHYESWKLLDWLIYAFGVLVYVSGFVLAAAWITLRIAMKVKPKPSGTKP